MSLSQKENRPDSVAGPVAVLGGGVEGRATVEYLHKHDVTDITVFDQNPVTGFPPGTIVQEGSIAPDHLTPFATVFRSPGFRPDREELLRAAQAGAVVTSALSYFMERCPCPVIGVTGTVGKGTCASLTAACLEASGFQVHLGGNIGVNPLDFLDDVRADHRVVLEISSFQAMDLSVSPQIAVVLKTTSEHLDWHRDTAEYRSAKAALVLHQTPENVVIYNADSEGAASIAGASIGTKISFSTETPVDNGIFLSDGFLFWARDGEIEKLPIDVSGVALKGKFNLENLAGGILAATTAGGALKKVCPAAQHFGALPHRLELCASAGGITFYNDSYATRPEATIAAISAFTEPLAVILGGSEKNADFTELATKILDTPNIVHLSLIGATAQRLAVAISSMGKIPPPMTFSATMEEAMEEAVTRLHGTGILLLAPACASFGLFPNYKVRGERFRSKALSLAANLA